MFLPDKTAPASIIAKMTALVRFLIASLFLFVLGIPHGMAELSESQIKSAYVLNFVKFAEWPAGARADGKVTLCVVGDNVLDGALSALDGRNAGGRELHVVQYSENFLATHPNAYRELRSCHVVFIGDSEQRHFISLIKALDDSPALTISDIEDFAEKGGSIGLRYRENRVVFEINLDSLKNSKLHLPSQLLNLAYYVFGKE